MAATTDLTYDEQFSEAVGADATSNFETGGNYAGSNPTENASSESLYAAGGLDAARKSAGLDDDEEDEDEDDDLDEDEDDDLEDDEDEDEDDLDDDDDLDDEDEDDEDEDEDYDDDEDEDDEEDEDDDATLKMEPSDSIRGRATDSARAAARKRR